MQPDPESRSAAYCHECGRVPYGSTPAPSPTTKYLCPYCNEAAVLRDKGVVIDRYRNVCHESCLERTARDYLASINTLAFRPTEERETVAAKAHMALTEALRDV